MRAVRQRDVDLNRNPVKVEGKTGPREVPINARVKEILTELVEHARSKGWQYQFVTRLSFLLILIRGLFF